MRGIWGLLLLLLGMLPVSAQEQCEQPWRVGFDNWKPYHYRDKQGMQGFSVEVLQAVAQRMGCSLEFVERPWRRTLQELTSGELILAMDAYYNEEREGFAYFSEPYGHGVTLLWMRAGEAGTEPDLAAWLHEGKRLGTTRGYYYGPKAAKAIARYPSQVSSLPNEAQNYGKLLLGRIDGFLGDRFATLWDLRQAGMAEKIEPHPMQIYAQSIHFMLSRRRVDEAFVARFNLALAAFRDSPEYDALLCRYAPVGTSVHSDCD